MLNNYDWMKEFSFLDFIRDVGKHITVNYMMAKDSVKRRLNGECSDGMSFTEFTYQLVQGYDFLHLRKHHGCMLQMGGSDQWGNITTGTELIRRKEGMEAYGLTWPLMTKSDGKKFGKTESGNIWLDPRRTSPYKFYQFWLNTTDDDAARYVKIFTLLPSAEIDALIAEHAEAPHLRKLQKTLAKEITCLIHGEAAYNAALEASQILFGNATSDSLRKIDEETFLSVFEGVPQFEITAADLKAGISIVDFLADKTAIMASKGEARRALKSNAVSINKEKVGGEEAVIGESHLVNGKYILAQSGKKNYFLVIVK
jgi:tyrosyl-tRNA synthetase